jgi:hypothetical protein
MNQGKMKSFDFRRYALSACAVVAILTGCGGQPPLRNGGVPSALVRAPSKTQTFYYTGAQQTFIVPAHVKHVTVTAMGAGTPSAHGGLVAATIAVKPGEPLAVFVGGERKGSTGGYNGGGYGGTYQCPTCTLIADGGAGASDAPRRHQWKRRKRPVSRWSRRRRRWSYRYARASRCE